MISGKEVYPLIEGGKGINASDGRSSGAWAHENCVGTFSGVSPDYYDSFGNVIFEKYFKKSRNCHVGRELSYHCFVSAARRVVKFLNCHSCAMTSVVYL